MEDTTSLGKFILSIPTADEELHARVEAALRKTNEESHSVELFSTVALGQAEGEDGPDELESRDPDGRTNASQDQVAGNLPNHVASRPACLHVVELVPVEVQVLLPVRKSA